jgi:hypothetical protein
MASIQSNIIEMMKNDPAINEVQAATDTQYITVTRGQYGDIYLVVESGNHTWFDMLEDETYTSSNLRIKTPPHSSDADDEGFSTPSPSVRRIQPPPVIRRHPDLPPPSGPLTRSFCDGGEFCEGFECMDTPLPPCVVNSPKPVNRHLFFDENGDETTREDYLTSLEPSSEPSVGGEWEREWGVSLPHISQPMIARHPRVLLSFFRFIKDLNEVALDHEKVKLPKMSLTDFQSVMKYIEKHAPPPEFTHEITDLQYFLSMNFAGLDFSS